MTPTDAQESIEQSADDRRLELVATLSAGCGREIAERDPAAPLAWQPVPTVAAMAAHLGVIHRWVAGIVRTRAAHRPRPAPDLEPEGLVGWFEEGRALLLDALAAVDPRTPCWVLGGRTGTVADWRRRMVFEHVKHLIDLRAAGGRDWEVAPELRPDDYADGIDELLVEFLPRTRGALAPLPAPVVLRSTDGDRSWRIGTDWSLGGEGGETVISGATGELALLLWERAAPLAPGSRLRVTGPPEAAAALAAAPIHPW